VSRLDLPVEVDVPTERFPAIEASAHLVVAEALTNVVKHSHAERAEVRAYVEDGILRVEIRATTVSAVPIRAVTGWWGLAVEKPPLAGNLWSKVRKVAVRF
jgi:nitrate/nitrite-specific signal transduction histidine kinase